MNPVANAIGLEVVELARAGRFTEICDLFAPPLRSMVTPEALEAAWRSELERLGPVTAVGEPACEASGAGIVVVRVPVTCERGQVTVIVSATEAGALAGIQLAPATAAEPTAPWQPPPYADQGAFGEEDVVLGTGPLAVHGTLSLPHTPGMHPAVVLLAGSGVLDRDETIGRNKPFKDLAWGLASHGVAVLRFDKVTFAHRDDVRSRAGFTVADEYMPHARSAIELLGRHSSVDPKRIYVLGHSLGGTVAPRVAADNPSVAGIILFAGGAEPLHWSALRQMRYLASLNPATVAASEPIFEVLTRQATMVDSPDLGESTPSDQLPFGIPAAYWLDLRSYQPVAAAASLDSRVLVLQGGRDYQVTVDGDLERWTTGLAGHRDVTVRVYPDDNHMFFSGSGPSNPAEYEPVQHVDPTVIADVARWITAG